MSCDNCEELTQKNAALVEALKRYAVHTATREDGGSDCFDGAGCLCGLTAALEASPAPVRMVSLERVREVLVAAWISSPEPFSLDAVLARLAAKEGA